MKCLFCGAEAPAHASICAQCGHKLVRPSLMWRRCEHCGNMVHLSRGICAACGYPVKRGRLRVWILAALAPVALALLAWGGRSAYAQLEASYLTAWPTALYEMSLADMATVTLVPLGPTVTPTASAAAMSRATARATDSVSATKTPSSSPTARTTATPPPPTDTPTATMVPTETSTPTAQDTPTATATAPLPSDTPTATAEALRYPAPALLEPADGAEFSGKGTDIWLRWASVGTLAADEFYAVSLRYQSDDAIAYTGTWYQGTEWMVPRDIWQRYDPGLPSIIGMWR